MKFGAVGLCQNLSKFNFGLLSVQYNPSLYRALTDLYISFY